jgi:hypothetical protein
VPFGPPAGGADGAIRSPWRRAEGKKPVSVTRTPHISRIRNA